MIQAVKRVVRIGENGVVRVEVTLVNSRTGAEVVLVTERPDLDPEMWVEEAAQGRSASLLTRP